MSPRKQRKKKPKLILRRADHLKIDGSAIIRVSRRVVVTIVDGESVRRLVIDQKGENN